MGVVLPVIKFSWNAVPSPVFGIPSPEIAVPPPKFLIPPPGDVFMVHTVFFGQLLLRKIISTVATTYQILRLKFTKFDFGWGSIPDPAGGTYSAFPDPIAGFKGAYFYTKGWDGKRGRKGKGRRGDRKGRGEKGREEV